MLTKTLTMFRQIAALLVPLTIIGSAYMYHEQKRHNYNELKLHLEEHKREMDEETQLKKLRGACTWVKCMLT